MVYSDKQVEVFEAQIKSRLSKTLKLLDIETQDQLREKVFNDIENIKNHNNLEIMHKYISLLYENPDTLLSYLRIHW